MPDKEWSRLSRLLLVMYRGRSNFHLFFGICLGLTLGLTLIPSLDFEPCATVTMETPVDDLVLPGNDLGVDLVSKGRKKREVVPPPPFLRPRFISTELGLRKKVLVGVILSDTTPSGIQRLLRINQTLSHTVDKVIFFASATSGEVNGPNQQLRALGLTGIVPIKVKLPGMMTYTEELVANHVALRALRYFGDKFRNNFDYYYLTLDRGYVNGRNLMQGLKRISVREEVLWGINNGDNSSCAIEFGFAMSRSILTLVSDRLSRCWTNAVLSNQYGTNFSKCFEYLAPNVTCRAEVQNQQYRVATTETVSLVNSTQGVIFIGPIATPEGILQIHGAFCQARKLEIDLEIKQFRSLMINLQPKIPESWRNLPWPLGSPLEIKPKNRFEVNRWTYFDSTTIFCKDSQTVSSLIDGVDTADVNHVKAMAYEFLQKTTRSTDSLQSQRSRHAFWNISHFKFIGGYRRFAPTRGMEYILEYKNQSSGGHVRVEGIRALTSSIEIVPVPFTTEDKRILFIVPITKVNRGQLKLFLDAWVSLTSDLRQNSTSVIIALVQNLKESNNDKILLNNAETSDLRDLIVAYNNGTHANHSSSTNNGSISKVGFVILTLRPSTPLRIGLLDVFGRRGLVRPLTLLMFLEPNVQLKEGFLNRVRLQTIQGAQVFSPIPFEEFTGSKAYQGKGHDLELDKERGDFNTKEYRIISFYYADYVEGRRSLSDKVRDLMKERDDARRLVELFVQGTTLHVFRATDPHLILRRIPSPLNITECANDLDLCSNKIWGSQDQLAKVLLKSGLVN